MSRTLLVMLRKCRPPVLIAVVAAVATLVWLPSPAHAAARAPAPVPVSPDIDFAIPAPITPADCRKEPQAGSVNGWIRDPYNWCLVYGPASVILMSSDPRDPGPLGAIDYAITEIASGSNKTRSATFRAYVDILGTAAYPGGPDMNSVKLAISVKCQGSPGGTGCQSATSDDEKTIGDWKTAHWTKSFTLDSTSAGTAAPSYVSTGVFYPKFTFSHPNAAPETIDPSTDDIEAGIRFDSAGGPVGYLGKSLPSGAIFGTVGAGRTVTVPEPQLTYSMASANNERVVAQHLYVALNHPDNTYPRPPAGLHKRFSATLQRLGSTTQADANRAVSIGLCAALWGPRYPTAYGTALDCDEYPFATTYQGGASAGINLSVCPLSAGSNRSAGSQLGIFYAFNRILDRESFSVKINLAGQPAPVMPPCPVPPSATAVINVPGGGAFATVWHATGGVTGLLGAPAGNWRVIRGGEEQDFQHGSILWSPRTGTREVHGAILAEYARTGGPAGRLGFPTSNEQNAPGGRENTFSGESCGSGSVILWTRTTGAHEMQGCIYDAYLKRFGGPGGGYGYPVGDETASKGGAGKVSYLADTACGSERGSGLFWSAHTSTWPVRGCIFAKYEQIGEDQSGLGFPLSGEFGTADGIRQNYEFGYMLYNAAGTHVFYSGSNPGCADYGPYGTGPDSCDGGFSTSGVWFPGGGIGLDGKEIWTYGNGSAVSSTAVYHLRTLGTTRAYQIQAYIPDYHSDATHAHYTLSSPGGGTDSVYVNQENYTNAWAVVGYVCTSNGTVQITLSDDGGESYPIEIGADAIRAVPTGYACNP